MAFCAIASQERDRGDPCRVAWQELGRSACRPYDSFLLRQDMAGVSPRDNGAQQMHRKDGDLCYFHLPVLRH